MREIIYNRTPLSQVSSPTRPSAPSALSQPPQINQSKKRKIWPMSLIFLPIFAFLLWWLGPGLLLRLKTAALSYSSRYVAVYLTNGQVLYGHLRGSASNTIKLTDVYYIQSVQVGDKTTSNLVKRGGSEISAPENFLLVNRQQVLYWEEVGNDSPVMKIIKPK